MAEGTSVAEGPIAAPTSADAAAVPAVTVADWQPALERYHAALRAQGRPPHGVGRYVTGAKHFIHWLVSKGWGPEHAKAQVAESTLGEFRRAQEEAGLVRVVRDADQNAAESFLHVLQGLELPPYAKKKKEQKMNRQGAQDAREVDLDELDAPEGIDGSDSETEEVEDIVPPSKRRASTATSPVQTVRVEVASPRGRTTTSQQGRASTGQFQTKSPLRNILPSSIKARIYKRARDGKLIYINDYSVDELGHGSIVKFIKQFVDPEHGDPMGITTYEAYEVGPDDQPKGQPATVTIQSEQRAPPADDPTQQLRNVMELVQELQASHEDKEKRLSDIMDAAKQKALQGTNGMNDIMMLMVLEKFMDKGGGKGDVAELAMKIAEKLKGPQVPFIPPEYMSPPPQPVQLPLPLPAESTLTPVVTKLLEVVTSPKPEKPEKDFMAQMKELMAFKELLMPKDTTADILREELRALREEMKQLRAGGVAGGGALDMVARFKEIKDVVQTLAPAINMGGISGALQSLITPKLAAAVGDMLAGAAAKAQGANAPVPQTAQLQAAPQEQPAQLPAQAQPEARPVPEAAKPHLITLMSAKEEKAQIESTCLALLAYYQDPSWQPVLTPPLQQLLMGELNPARGMVKEFLSNVRPDLSNDIMAEKVVQTLVAQIQTATGVAPANGAAGVTEPQSAQPATPQAAKV